MVSLSLRRAYQHTVFQFIGSDVITRRQALESALKSALVAAVPNGEILARCGNYLTYPATTVGYTGFSSILYECKLWLVRDLAPNAEDLAAREKTTLPRGIFSIITFIRQQVQAKFNNDTDLILTERQYLQIAPQQQQQQQQQRGAVDPAPDRAPYWADTLSRIQVTGAEVLPFAADKATVFSEAVYRALGNQTIYTVNVSDVTTVTARVDARKLLQTATSSVILDVWTNSLAANFTPSVIWGGVFNSEALASLGPRKANWTGTFLNATMHLRSINGSDVGTRQDPALNSTAGAPQPSDISLSAGAIAGIVIAAVVLAAALAAVALWLVFKKGLAAKRQGRHEAAAAVKTDGSSSSESSDIGGAKKAASVSMMNGSTVWKPQLCAADIQFSTDVAGKRIVLGGGAFSMVYKGTHLHRDVAIKLLQLDGNSAHAVQREVQLAERVSQDANVVQVYGAAAAHDGQSVMLVMELMQGGDLRAALDGPDGAQCLWHNRGPAIAADVARGLVYIHTTGVVHRDLKSSNILLAADGRTAKVADIGSAAMMDAGYISQHFGTLAWAAPELLLADRSSKLDAKADSYSFGVVLWELITGEIPVRGNMRPVRVPEECPAAVAALVQRCMAASPAERPSADQISKQLQRLRAGAQL